MRCDFVSRDEDATTTERNGKENGMSDKNLKASSGTKKAAGCGCAQAGNGHDCPCKKRICLPILSLVGIAVVVSLAAKRRNRK